MTWRDVLARFVDDVRDRARATERRLVARQVERAGELGLVPTEADEIEALREGAVRDARTIAELRARLLDSRPPEWKAAEFWPDSLLAFFSSTAFAAFERSMAENLGPGVVSTLDQFSASLRERLTERGLDLDDPVTVRALLVGVEAVGLVGTSIGVPVGRPLANRALFHLSPVARPFLDGLDR